MIFSDFLVTEENSLSSKKSISHVLVTTRCSILGS